MNTRNIPQAQLLRLNDFIMSAAFATRGAHDHKLIPLVLEQYLERGEAVLPSHALATRFGTTRRAICNARRRLVDAGFIRRVAINERQQGIYVPCLERADEYRAHLNRVGRDHAA